jgi:hypothetical protein
MSSCHTTGPPFLLKIVDITLKQSLSGGLDLDDINNGISGKEIKE